MQRGCAYKIDAKGMLCWVLVSHVEMIFLGLHESFFTHPEQTLCEDNMIRVVCISHEATTTTVLEKVLGSAINDVWSVFLRFMS